MKNSKILGIAAALSMGFAACSDDAQVNAPDNSQEGVTKYMSVVIKNVGDNSRALPGDSDFEGPATGSNESDITKDNIRFYFFTDKGSPFIMSTVNVNGTVTKTNMVAPTAISQINNTNGAAATFNGVLVLGLPDTENGGYEGNTPAKVVAIVNPRHADGFNHYAQKTLDQLYSLDVKLQNLDFDQFTMVSSSYVDNVNGKDTEIYWTDVTGNIKDTQAEAETAPAQIFLERLAAKVRVKGLGEYVVQERNAAGELANKTFRIWENSVAPTETTLSVTLDGWKLLNRANHTYAIKHIRDFIANPPYEGWNDPARHRSYWAYTAATSAEDFYDRSFKFDDTNWLGNFDANKPTDNILYTYGNTAFARGEEATDATSATDRSTLATAIIVKAFVKKTGATNPIDLVKWGPEYYSLDYFKEVVISAWNNDHSSNFTKDAVGLKYVKDNHYVATVSVNGTAQDYPRFSDISYWDGGVTSYLANVKHYAAQNENKALYGVVRNHIYDYTFNNVVGLGVPGTDPVNPEDPDQNYLAAVVNCLNWHVVSYNDVTLGE